MKMRVGVFLAILMLGMPLLYASDYKLVGIGTEGESSLPLTTDKLIFARGATTMELEWERLQLIKLDADGEGVEIVFRNGDGLTGEVDREAIRFDPLKIGDLLEVWVVNRVVSRKGLVTHYDFGAPGVSVSNVVGKEHAGNRRGAKWHEIFKNRPGVYLFDGVDDAIVVPHDPALSPTKAVTVSVWVWKNDWADAVVSAVVSKTHVGGYSLGLNHSKEKKSKIFGWTNLTDRYVKAATSFNPSNGRWHHLTTTTDGASVKLYVDGLLVGEGKAAVRGLIAYRHENALCIGTEAGPGEDPEGQYYFAGALDDVMIWNRALSQEEILSLYTSQREYD